MGMFSREATVDPILLNGREYKLLLKPTKFTGDPSVGLANNFWNHHLKPIINGHLDKRSGGKLRSKGQFVSAKIRSVRFWDSKGHVLAGCDLSLRQRGKTLDTHGDQEITLKLRTSDLFISGLTAVTGSHPDAETKLEEDIAPLQVQLPRSRTGRKVVVDYGATRSRFSHSTTQPLAADRVPGTLAQACELFPSLKKLCGDQRDSSLKTRLMPGPAIEEHVFKGPKVDLGGGISAEFALTFWYFGKRRRTPDVSEISFRCSMVDKSLGLPAARHAHLLFAAMQKELAGWVNAENSSKTALALP
jgi:hypothetical protein